MNHPLGNWAKTQDNDNKPIQKCLNTIKNCKENRLHWNKQINNVYLEFKTKEKKKTSKGYSVNHQCHCKIKHNQNQQTKWNAWKQSTPWDIVEKSKKHTSLIEEWKVELISEKEFMKIQKDLK